MYRGMWRLYLPLSVLVGVLVALPTLAAHSTVGRSLGVLAGVAVLAVAVVGVVRSGRRPGRTGTVRYLGTFSGQATISGTVSPGGGDSAAAMRRVRRLHRLVRLWPLLTGAGVLAGALVGAVVGSFLLTVALAALGFLVPNVATMALGLAGMRRLSGGSLPRG